MTVKSGRRILRCKTDGLVMVNPQPSVHELDRFYNTEYFASKKKRISSSLGYFDYLSERPLLLSYFRRKTEFLKQLIHGRKLLEIGSGYGFFLEEAKKRFDVLGIDISRPAVVYAQKHGLPERTADLFKEKFPENAFDGIAAFHLIEHVPNPLLFMREVYRITKPGGLVFLATPDQGGYLERIMGNSWFSYRHAEHLYFFSRRTMTQLLSKAGFTDVRFWRDETRFYPVNHLVRGLKYFSHFLILSRILELLFGWITVQVPMPLDTMIVTARK